MSPTSPQQPVTHGSAAATTAIPFRQSGPGGEQLVGAMAVCVLLLALVYVLLRIAKQRGWLERWGVSAAGGVAPGAASFVVLQQKRLSPKTVVFLIRHGTTEYVLAETPAGVALLDKLPIEQDKSEG